MSDSDKKLLIATLIVISAVVMIVLFAWNSDIQAGRMDIHRAVRKGKLSKINFILVERPESVNARDKLLGGTPLHTAAWGKNKAIIEVLVANGADIDAKDKYGKTPLAEAVVWGSIDVVETLIALGASINIKDSDGGTPLDWAVANGRKDCVEVLLAHGANVNAISKIWAPLHEAAFHGSKDIAEFLIDNGAEVNMKDKSGRTPLFIAIENGHEEVVDLLRKHGAVK